jgi:hypothetical protein
MPNMPLIKRARGFRLYTQNGAWLTDLWQCGGAAVLGHKPAHVVRELKNTAECGLLAPLPSIYEKRLLKVLPLLFGTNSGAIFRFWQGQILQEEQSALDIPWRPFSDFDTKAPLFRAILPCPLAPQLLVMEKAAAEKFLLPPPLPVSPIILAATIRAIHDLLASPERGKVQFSLITKAFANESLAKNWTLNGIYIYPREDIRRQWPAVCALFLEQGFYISPSPSDPIILPGELSKGEETKLANLLLSVISTI